jgi:hypothetical protein
MLSRGTQVILSCTRCGEQFEWIPNSGSYPLEDDIALQISQGPLGPRVVSGIDTAGIGRERKGLTRLSICICVATILILILILSNAGPFFFG